MKSARQIEVQMEITALEDKVEAVSNKITEVRVAYTQKMLDAVMPLFTKYRVLEGDRVLSGDGYYLYIKDSRGFEIVNIYGSSYGEKIHLKPSYYSTNEVSEFEFARMITLGRVGELFLNDKATLEATMEGVFEERGKILTELYDERKDLNSQLGILYPELRELTFRECLGVLQGGVSFTGLGRRPRLQTRFNAEPAIDYLKFVTSKGTFSIVSIKYATEPVEEALRIKTDYLRDFVRMNQDTILA